MCTRVGMISGGRMIVQDQLETLRKPSGEVRVRTPDMARVAEIVGGRLLATNGEWVTVHSEDSAQLNSTLVEAGVRIIEIEEHRPSLEEIFLASTEASVFS